MSDESYLFIDVRNLQTPNAIPEKAFQQQVTSLAKMRGWLTYHTLRSRGSEPGFPDNIFVRRGRLVVAELKVGREKPTAPQRAWLEAFRLVPQAEVFLWYPDDLDEINRVLR